LTCILIVSIHLSTECRTRAPIWQTSGRTNKGDDNAAHFQSRVIGMQVVCGPIDGTLLYYTDEFVGSGANVMIEIQRQALKDLADLLSAKGLRLPRYLMLQFDNCGENKVKPASFTDVSTNNLHTF